MVREVSRPIPEAPPVTTAASPANSSLIRAPLLSAARTGPSVAP
jgi:hypothetical protein